MCVLHLLVRYFYKIYWYKPYCKHEETYIFLFIYRKGTSLHQEFECSHAEFKVITLRFFFSFVLLLVVTVNQNYKHSCKIINQRLLKRKMEMFHYIIVLQKLYASRNTFFSNKLSPCIYFLLCFVPFRLQII